MAVQKIQRLKEPKKAGKRMNTNAHAFFKQVTRSDWNASACLAKLLLQRLLNALCTQTITHSKHSRNCYITFT